MGEKLKNGIKVAAGKVKDIANEKINISVGEYLFNFLIVGGASIAICKIAQRASYSLGVSDGIAWVLNMMEKERSK